MQDAYRKADPKGYLRSFLEKDTRPDGRGLMQCRELKFQTECIDTCAGSSVVRLGETVVSCGVHLEPVMPDVNRPNDGFLEVNVSVPPLCGPEFAKNQKNRMNPYEYLSELLHGWLVDSGTINLRAFAIEENVYAWKAYVDILCLSYDGNLADVSLIAAQLALRNLRIPNAIVEDGELKYGKKFKEWKLQSFLFPLTLITFDKKVLVDPTAEETELAETRTHIVVSGERELHYVSQIGNSGQSVNRLKNFCNVSFDRAEQMKKILSL